MPHRRRKKKVADTKLVFDAASSFLYLSVLSVSEEDTVLVPLDTCLVLSVIKAAGAEDLVNIRFVQGQSEHLSVVVRRDSVKFCAAEAPIPKPVANCRLYWYC